MNRPASRPLWARVAIEVALVVLALLSGLLMVGVRLTPDVGGTTPSDALIALDIALGLIAVALMPLRRRWPLTITILVIGCLSFSSFSVVAFLICAGSLATRRRMSDLYVVAPLMLLALAVTLFGLPLQEWAATLASGALTLGLFWAGGAYLGARRDLLASARERAATLEREQSLRVIQAQTAERTRIAQEMHDVLAHRISLIAVHANVLAYRDDLTREQTREHATVVREAAEKAVNELAGVLGVLRGADGVDNALPPQPTLARVADLIDDARRAGTPVAVVGALPDLDTLADDVSRTAYRVVQECLTNARKHATGQPMTIAITGQEGSHLSIEARNLIVAAEPAIAGSGMGLIGLTERLGLAGGRLEFGEDEGFFVVRARLEWRNE